MQVEEDLGYTISAETLPSFTRVNHYITYIEHVEAFKKENNKAPIGWSVAINLYILLSFERSDTDDLFTLYRMNGI